MKIRVSAFIAALCLSVCLPAAGVERVVEKTFIAGNGGTLFLDSSLGSVEINSHPGNEVKINVTLEAKTSNDGRAEEIFDNFELTFAHDARDVTITGKLREQWLWRNFRLRVHFNITVPEKYNLQVETSGGNIAVADIQGKVDIRTSGGSISVGKVKGAVNARTSGGSITLDSSEGNSHVNTSGGSIRIGKVKGDLEAVTSGGGIDVDGVEGSLVASSSGGGLHFRNVDGSLRARTSGGPIKAALTSQVDAPVELRTSGGSIVLELPEGFNADLNASTSGGHVYTDLPVTVQGRISKSSLTGRLNDGGPEVFLRTSGGSIEIRKIN